MNEPRKIQVLLVDDHPLTRQGLRQTIAQLPQLEVTAEASNAAEALEAVSKVPPSLVIMDVHLPDLDGVRLSQRILSLLPSCKILMFSADPNQQQVQDALKAGVCGYLLKTGALNEFLQAIESVQAGRIYLSPELNAQILEDYRRRLINPSNSSRPNLSGREEEVLRLIATGLRAKEIAARLNLSPKTAETYRSRLMKKVGCSSTAELVRYALREGIVAD